MKKFVKFIAVGLGGTILSYFCYLLLLEFLTYQQSYFISYALGIVYSYIFNSRYVFKSGLSIKKFLIFPSVYILQYLCSALGLFWLVDKLYLNASYAPIVVSVVTIPITFVVSKFVLERTETRVSR